MRGWVRFQLVVATLLGMNALPGCNPPSVHSLPPVEANHHETASAKLPTVEVNSGEDVAEHNGPSENPAAFEAAPYRPAPGVSGVIKCVGSDTMNNLMALWLAGFEKQYPDIRYEIEGKGSGTAPPALISGAATFGPMSRAMKPSEVDEFEKKFGYKPTQAPVAIDMVAVYVHRDNPVKSISIQQLDAIFSSTRKRGGGEIVTWGDLGCGGEWADRPLSVYGRNSASGTYGVFKQKVLLEGDFSNDVKEQPGSSAVVQGIASDRGGIGYSGIGYKTADVKTVPLSVDGAPAVKPALQQAYNGQYPLVRILWLTLNHRPNSHLDPLRREFVKYIYSQEGQAAITRDGYFPVNNLLVKKSLAKLGIDP